MLLGKVFTKVPSRCGGDVAVFKEPARQLRAVARAVLAVSVDVERSLWFAVDAEAQSLQAGKQLVAAKAKELAALFKDGKVVAGKSGECGVLGGR